VIDPLRHRPSMDQTLITVAYAMQDRSTCARNHVGAVISRDNRIISTGYNGAPAGMPHCDHGVLPPLSSDRNRGCLISIHAEANAIAYAARHGVSIEGATVHTTLSPCYTCSQLIIAAGLARVVYDRPYRDEAGLDLLRAAGVTVDYLRLGLPNR
jgi:dCMP deaminase